MHNTHRMGAIFCNVCGMIVGEKDTAEFINALALIMPDEHRRMLQAIDLNWMMHHTLDTNGTKHFQDLCDLRGSQCQMNPLHFGERESAYNHEHESDYQPNHDCNRYILDSSNLSTHMYQTLKSEYSIELDMHYKGELDLSHWSDHCIHECCKLLENQNNIWAADLKTSMGRINRNIRDNFTYKNGRTKFARCFVLSILGFNVKNYDNSLLNAQYLTEAPSSLIAQALRKSGKRIKIENVERLVYLLSPPISFDNIKKPIDVIGKKTNKENCQISKETNSKKESNTMLKKKSTNGYVQLLFADDAQKNV